MPRTADKLQAMRAVKVYWHKNAILVLQAFVIDKTGKKIDKNENLKIISWKLMTSNRTIAIAESVTAANI